MSTSIDDPRRLRQLLAVTWRRYAAVILPEEWRRQRPKAFIWCLAQETTYEEAARLHDLFHELGWLRDDELTDLGRAQVVQYEMEEANRGG